MTIIIDTPEGIAWYRFQVMIKRMELELNTGIGFRVSTFGAAKEELGLKPRFSKQRTLNIYRAYADFMVS